MAYIVRNLPTLVATSSGKTIAIGLLDDANNITIFPASTASGTVGAIVQISQFDPAIATEVGVTQSTFWVTAGTVSSSNTAVAIANVSFRGLRLISTSTAFTANEIVAYVSKQISV